MKIAVYGGTGNIGSRVVAEAVARGHEVTALSRRAGDAPAGATAAIGDAADVAGVRAVAAEHDAVVSAIGPSRDPGGDRTEYLRMLRGLLDAVGSTRLAVVGGAGSLLVDGGRLVDQPDFPEIYKPESLVVAEGLEIVRAAGPDVDWTYLSPAPEIGPGERTGSYRTALDEPAGSFVSFDDYAVALVDELERPAHRRERFTVATRLRGE